MSDNFGYDRPLGASVAEAIDERADDGDVMDRYVNKYDPWTLDDLPTGGGLPMRLSIGITPTGPDGVPEPPMVTSAELWM